jgi:hypothetical protein
MSPQRGEPKRRQRELESTRIEFFCLALGRAAIEVLQKSWKRALMWNLGSQKSEPLYRPVVELEKFTKSQTHALVLRMDEQESS